MTRAWHRWGWERGLGWTARIALLLAIAATIARAQTTTTEAPTKGPYRIDGTIVNALTGAPLQRATVSVLTEKDSRIVESVVADENGHFALVELGAAKYQLTASKRGFRTGFYDEHDEYNTAIVTGPDQDTEHLTFRLTPNGTLHGVVTGDGGDPVEGARVMLFLLPHGTGNNTAQTGGTENRIEEVEATATDDTGAYEFGHLDAGQYDVAVMAEPWYAVHNASGLRKTGADDEGVSGMNAALDVAYPVTYFDSTTDESAATPIVVAEGSRNEADINLHAEPALHLLVAVPHRQNGGIAQPDLRQSIFGTQVSAESAGFIDALQSGFVEFTGVAPGHYELTQGDPPRVVGLDATFSQQVDPTAGAPTVTVEGTLRATAGQTVPDDVNVAIYPQNSTLQQIPMEARAQRGRFRLEDVPPGTWDLRASIAGREFSTIAIAANGATHGGGLITVGDQPVEITATVATAETRVTGFARKNGKGFAGALVVLVPRDPAAFDGLVRRDQSDSDGSFSLRDVAPGQYTLVAIESAWNIDHAGRDAMARYLPQGTTVLVTGNSGVLMHLAEPIAVQER